MCDPVSLGVGTAVVGGAKAVSGFQQKKDQASIANKQRAEQYKQQVKQRQLDTVQRYSVYNQKLSQYEQSGRRALAALNRGYGQAQAQLNDVYDSADFATQQQLIDVQKEIGRTAARGQSGQSVQLAMQDSLAQYGRNQAILAANIMGARNRFAYDVEGLRQRYESNRNAAYGNVAIAPTQTLAPIKPQYNKGPSTLGLVADLGSAALSGFSTYNSLKAPGTGLPDNPLPETDLPFGTLDLNPLPGTPTPPVTLPQSSFA